MTKREEQMLRNAVESLKNYCEPENGRCAVAREAREASKLYLETWVLARLEAVLDRRGEDRNLRDFEVW